MELTYKNVRVNLVRKNYIASTLGVNLIILIILKIS